MNKSKSYPEFFKDKNNMRKCNSLNKLDLDEFYFEEFFEGDGELGIVFTKYKGNIIVKNIIPKTVASETYGLYKSMILINIDNKDINDKSLEEIDKKIRNKWFKNNRIYLKFQKPIYQEVYTQLLNYDLLKFYDNFVELGAKTNEDFEFVEYEDLIKMDMNNNDILSFKNINPNI